MREREEKINIQAEAYVRAMKILEEEKKAKLFRGSVPDSAGLAITTDWNLQKKEEIYNGPTLNSVSYPMGELAVCAQSYEKKEDSNE